MSKKNKRKRITFWHSSECVILDVEEIFLVNADRSELHRTTLHNIIAQKRKKIFKITALNLADIRDNTIALNKV